MIIGLTGPTGSGKSTVAEQFLLHGVKIIDCDALARKAVEKESECLKRLVVAFGNEILNDDKTLNRGKLAEIAFSCKQKTQMLNSITHPYIVSLIKDKINEYKAFSVLLDAPTLFESKADLLCDKTVCVICDLDKRKDRIIKRDNLTDDSANARLSAQKQNDFFISRCDYVIVNNSTLEALKEKTEQIILSLGV